MSNPLAETPLPSLLRPRVHADLHAQITAAFKSVYDPEIPVDIFELGLIYGYDIQDNGHVAIQMTLTAPACPEAGTLPGMVESRVAEIDGVNGASVASDSAKVVATNVAWMVCGPALTGSRIF
jgi:metal-sulfur cluster biosynthetic enzyme